MLNRFVIVLIVLGITAACSSNKKTAISIPENPKPEWVLNKPINPMYYYGLGSVNTRIHTSDYQQIAKSKALEDMASEIEVSIDARSILRQKETNTAFIENYEATTRIAVENNISDYETVDSWLNENEYWVLYRLSKEEYKLLEAEKRNQAINKAMHYLDLSETEDNYKEHFSYLLQAIDAIKGYLNDPLRTERNNQEVYLGNYIISRINDQLTQLELIEGRSLINLDWNNCYKENVSLSVQSDNVPVADVPVRLHFNTYASQKVMSDKNGLINYPIKANYYEEIPTTIKAWIKTSDIIKDPLIAALYEDRYRELSMSITLKKPNVMLETEKAKGLLEEKIEKAKARLSIDAQSTDVFLEMKYKITAIGETKDFKTSSCDIVMSLYDKDHILIEKKTWPSAKGVHTNKVSADNKALENAVKQIKYTWIQKLLMEHCNDQ